MVLFRRLLRPFLSLFRRILRIAEIQQQLPPKQRLRQLTLLTFGNTIIYSTIDSKTVKETSVISYTNGA